MRRDWAGTAGKSFRKTCCGCCPGWLTSLLVPPLANATQVQGLLGNVPGLLLVSLTQLLFRASSPHVSGCLLHMGAGRKGEHEAGWLNSFFVGVRGQAGASGSGTEAVPPWVVLSLLALWTGVQSVWRWAGLSPEDSQTSCSVSLKRSQAAGRREFGVFGAPFSPPVGLPLLHPPGPWEEAGHWSQRPCHTEAHPKAPASLSLNSTHLPAVLTRGDTPPKVLFSTRRGRVPAGKMGHQLPLPLTCPDILSPSLGLPNRQYGRLLRVKQAPHLRSGAGLGRRSLPRAGEGICGLRESHHRSCCCSTKTTI